jgi:hypothetical protein
MQRSCCSHFRGFQTELHKENGVFIGGNFMHIVGALTENRSTAAEKIRDMFTSSKRNNA